MECCSFLSDVTVDAREVEPNGVTHGLQVRFLKGKNNVQSSDSALLTVFLNRKGLPFPRCQLSEHMPSPRLSRPNWILARDAYCGVLQSCMSIDQIESKLGSHSLMLHETTYQRELRFPCGLQSLGLIERPMSSCYMPLVHRKIWKETTNDVT